MQVFNMVSISSLLMNLYISNQKTDNRYDMKKTFSPVGIEVVDCEAVLYLFICIAWSKTLTVFTYMRQKRRAPLRNIFSPMIHSSLVMSPLFSVSKTLKIRSIRIRSLYYQGSLLSFSVSKTLKIRSIRMSSVILKTVWRNSLNVFLFILSISSVCSRYSSNRN